MMWVQINSYTTACARSFRRNGAGQPVAPAEHGIKGSCQTLTGIAEGTFYRDHQACILSAGLYRSAAADQHHPVLTPNIRCDGGAI